MKKHNTGKAIPFMMVTLDKPRKLRLGMSAIVEYEMLTGDSVMKINKDSSIGTLMRLMWIMLKQEEPELTFEQTLKLIDEYGGDLTEIMLIIGEVISMAFGSEVDAPKPPEKDEKIKLVE